MKPTDTVMATGQPEISHTIWLPFDGDDDDDGNSRGAFNLNRWIDRWMYDG